MRFAYADPPYLGLAAKYFTKDHLEAAEYDKPETHRALIDRLSAEFDGWALSLHSPSLRTILPMCPPDVRVMAWCKPWASYKPGVNPAYAWEPVIVSGGRKIGRHRSKRWGDRPTLADFCLVSSTLRRQFQGAKPERMIWWLLAVLNVKADDDFIDLFPGSGAVGRAWETWRAQMPLAAVG